MGWIPRLISRVLKNICLVYPEGGVELWSTPPPHPIWTPRPGAFFRIAVSVRPNQSLTTSMSHVPLGGSETRCGLMLM